ncbi:hypothetical protein Tco_1137178 [Tanacetum coccineum]
MQSTTLPKPLQNLSKDFVSFLTEHLKMEKDGDVTVFQQNQVHTASCYFLNDKFKDIIESSSTDIKASATLNIQAFKIKKKCEHYSEMTQVHKMAKDQMRMIEKFMTFSESYHQEDNCYSSATTKRLIAQHMADMLFYIEQKEIRDTENKSREKTLKTNHVTKGHVFRLEYQLGTTQQAAPL